MKKVLVVALSALLILALFIPALAEDAPKFTTTVSVAKVKQGETLTVKVIMDKGINTQGLAVDYASITGDSANFEFVDAEWSEFIDDEALLADAGEQKAVSAFKKAEDVPAGEIFTLTVKAKADAAFGSNAFEIAVVIGGDTAGATEGTTVEIYHDCVPATTYSHDAEGHWYACTVDGCTVAPTKLGHDWTNACDELCDACGETRTITHDYSVQNKDATNHWMECSVCHKVDESTKAAHIESGNILVTPADCKDAAVYKKECTVCHLQLGANFPVGDPDASLHSGGTATCTAKAVCQHCAQPYGDVDPSNHVGTKKVEKNDTEHWTVCESCNTEIANTRAAHTGGTATCVDKAVCSCGQAYGAVDPENHTGNTLPITAVPSSCTVLGKKEGVKCADCDAVLSQDPEDALAPHSITTWTEIKPASETEEGEKKGKCGACETEFTVKTDKLASSIKTENMVAPEGSKVELGETKLPENTVVAIVPLEDEDLEIVAQELQEYVTEVPDIAGKELLAATSVAILPTYSYVDPATGEVIVDDDVSINLPGKVKVTAPITADLSNYENIIVLVVDAEGEISKIDATVVNGKVVFETDSVAGGVLVMGVEKKAPIAPDASGDAGAQTGDASQVVLFVSLAIVSVLTLGGIYVSKKAKASK